MSWEALAKAKLTRDKTSNTHNFCQVTKTLQLVRNATHNMRNMGPIRGTEKVMYPRKSNEAQKNPVIEGTPVTESLAVELRRVVFGSSVAPPRGEWFRTGFCFREPEQELSYGLKGSRNSTTGLLSVVQAHLIKYFLFEKRKLGVGNPEILLKPNRNQQIEALSSSLSDIIWMIGEKKSSTVCLPREKPSFQNSSSYYADGVTEFLHTFNFLTVEDLRAFIKRYIHLFLEESGPGVLLLLYSAILTRTIKQVIKDMEKDSSYLISNEEEGSSCIITLLLTGRATPYLHNGVVYIGDEDHYALPQWGIMIRSDIGFLVHNDGGDSKNLDESKQPGSRLKTPSYPVWVVNCSGHYGVLFNTNSELLRNYHAERRFDLYYFSVAGHQALMSIDTRYRKTSKQNESNDHGKHEESTIAGSSFIEKVIHTKWQDASINFYSPPPTI